MNRSLVLGASALVSIVACAPAAADDPDVVAARDGTDLVSHEGDVEILTASLVGSSGGALALAEFPLAGDLHTNDLGDGAKALFFPKGCLSTTHPAQTNEVTYTFDDCLGPFGLRRLTGSVKIVFARSTTGLSLDATATGLAVGRATLDLVAHAEVTAVGVERRAAWHAELEGTTARDRAFRRVVDRTLVSRTGEACITANGASTGTVEGTSLGVTVSDLVRCRGACPEAGGHVEALRQGLPALVLDFDGTTEAKVSIGGKTKSIALACAR